MKKNVEVERPVGVVVFGILEIIYSGFYLIASIISLVFFGIVVASPDSALPDSVGGYFYFIPLLISMVLLALNLVAAINVIRMRPWARKLMIWVAGLAIAQRAVPILFVAVWGTVYPGSMGPSANLGTLGGVFFWVMMGGILALSAAYNGALIWYFCTPKVKKAFGK